MNRDRDLSRVARTTGAFYLAFFVTGILGTVVVRGQLFVAHDPAATLANLTGHAWLARLDIVLELAIVLCQALTALWFYRLFRGVDGFAASALVLFVMGYLLIVGVRKHTAQPTTPAAQDADPRWDLTRQGRPS